MHAGWTYDQSGFLSSARRPPSILAEESLFKERNATGQFWPSSHPESKFWGRVEFRPGDGIHLTLEGCLSQAGFLHSGARFLAIHGVLFNGALCTIFECICHVETYRSQEGFHHRSLLRGEVLAMGGHFARLDAVQVAAISVRLSHLNEWFPAPFDLTYDPTTLERASLSFVPPRLRFQLSYKEQPFELCVSSGATFPTAPAKGKIQWTYAHWLQVKSSQPRELPWFLDVISSIRRCWTFLVGCGIYTLELKASLPDGDAPPSEGSAPAELGLFLPVTMPLVVRQDPFYFSTLFVDLESELPALLRNWFLRSSELEIVTRSYAEVLQNDGAYDESVFVRVIQVLEHFHGVLRPESGRYLSTTKWGQFHTWLGEHLQESRRVPPELAEDGANELKAVVVRRISSLNSKSLRSRLEELTRSIPGHWLMPIFGDPPALAPALETFFEEVDATRNYLTHFRKSLQARALRGEQLEAATARCWAILSFLLAHSLGLDQEKAGHIAMKAHRAMFLVGRRLDL